MLFSILQNLVRHCNGQSLFLECKQIMYVTYFFGDKGAGSTKSTPFFCIATLYKDLSPYLFVR